MSHRTYAVLYQVVSVSFWCGTNVNAILVIQGMSWELDLLVGVAWA